MKNFYPIFLDVAGKRAVVIGGGAVAARKAATLSSAGALVLVISPELHPDLALMVKNGAVAHESRRYQPGDLAGAAVAVAATDNPETNIKAASEARASGVPVNCVRPPDAGDFIVPSSIKRGDLTVAISTGGGCPALSKRIRKDLESILGAEYGEFLEFLEESRGYLKSKVADEKNRQEALTALVESGMVEAFRGNPGAARVRGKAMLEELVARYGR